jgi:translation initiation factor IF-1
MSKGDLLEMPGEITDALGGGQYRIKLDEGDVHIRGRLSGRMRRFRIRVLPGDRVRVAVSPYDLTHGFIVFRERR